MVCILFYMSLPIKSSKTLFLPSGSTFKIISKLNKNMPYFCFLDTIALRIIGYPQSGWLQLSNTTITKGDFLYSLTKAKGLDVSITILPGESYYFFLLKISKDLRLDFNKLLKYYYELSYQKDGNILAQTYKIPKGIKEKELIKLLIETSDVFYKKLSYELLGKYNKKEWYRYLTIASILQKESANIEEMPLVSSVIHNRLARGMRLQMDGSLKYGKFANDIITAKTIRENKNDYNTYKTRGLPHNPVCAVGEEAIKAAINPAKTNYLYFVRYKYKKKHIFASTYKEHEANIKAQYKIRKR